MRLFATGLLAALALVGAGCGSDDSSGEGSGGNSTASSGASDATKVDIKDFKYAPPDISVKKGAKVTFTNSDTAPHTATDKASNSSFDTGKLNEGDSKAVTFGKAGTFNYYCVYHAFMKGKVTVK